MSFFVARIIIISLVSGVLYTVFEVAIGAVFIYLLGLHDPWPRAAEFNLVLQDIPWFGLKFAVIYALTLAISLKQTAKTPTYYLLLLSILSSFILSLFYRWFDIPKQPGEVGIIVLPLIALTMPVIFMVSISIVHRIGRGVLFRNAS